MNYTQNYQLPQWESSDRILMDDFNDAMEKIEGGLSGLDVNLPKLATGTYAGTGEYGASHPNTLTFDFKPYVVLCYNRASYSTPALLIRGEDRYLADYGNSYAEMLLTWGRTPSPGTTKRTNASSSTMRAPPTATWPLAGEAKERTPGIRPGSSLRMG